MLGIVEHFADQLLVIVAVILLPLGRVLLILNLRKMPLDVVVIILEVKLASERLLGKALDILVLGPVGLIAIIRWSGRQLRAYIRPQLLSHDGLLVLKAVFVNVLRNQLLVHLVELDVQFVDVFPDLIIYLYRSLNVLQ